MINPNSMFQNAAAKVENNEDSDGGVAPEADEAPIYAEGGSE